MKKVFLSVTNDIVTDQRVNRIASTLADNGLYVVIVGVKRKNSKEFSTETYQGVLLKSPFQKGILFYSCFNFILFWYLLFRKTDVLVANDLDTLPANFLVSILKRKVLIYDSHELFTEVPEIIHRPIVKKVWTYLEKLIIPHLKHNYTVCESIAEIYSKTYKVPFSVVRNVPFRREKIEDRQQPEFKNKKIIIYQGALNIGRGIENAIKAMAYLENTQLLIAGRGDIENDLKLLVEKEKLQDKVQFLGSLIPSKLFLYTSSADLGFSLEQNIGLSYYYSLPNKLFDYIQARIPVLVSNLPEMSAIVKQYNIGEISSSHEPEKLALQFKEMLANEQKRETWRKNLELAASELCWENEKEKLVRIYRYAGVID